MTAFIGYQGLSTLPYSGFGRRCVAYLIDNALIYIAVFAVQFLLVDLLAGDIPLEEEMTTDGTARTTSAGLIFGILGPWIYYALLESGTHQGTLGKMAMGLQVTDIYGQGISFGRATGRYFGKFPSFMILTLGLSILLSTVSKPILALSFLLLLTGVFLFIMAAFTEKRQALHDLMSGCVILRKGERSNTGIDS